VRRKTAWLESSWA